MTISPFVDVRKQTNVAASFGAVVTLTGGFRGSGVDIGMTGRGAYQPLASALAALTSEVIEDAERSSDLVRLRTSPASELRTSATIVASSIIMPTLVRSSLTMCSVSAGMRGSVMAPVMLFAARKSTRSFACSATFDWTAQLNRAWVSHRFSESPLGPGFSG